METFNCGTCAEGRGNLICRGCSKSFCTIHAVTHRQSITDTLKSINVQFQQLVKTVQDISNQTLRHPLMQQINDWEEDTIRKVREAAELSRHQLNDALIGIEVPLRSQLDQLMSTLNDYQLDDNFLEKDLDDLKTRLEDLKKAFLEPTEITIRDEHVKHSWIGQLFVIQLKTDTFAESIGSIQIKNDKKGIVHGYLPQFGAVRGTGEYQAGCFQIEFQVEGAIGGDEIFLGILSKSSRLSSNPIGSQGAYGWTTGTNIILSGELYDGSENYYCDMKNGDVMQLFLFCDHRKISLRNKRTKSYHSIDVDADKCPLPWQLHFSLAYWDDAFRLL